MKSKVLHTLLVAAGSAAAMAGETLLPLPQMSAPAIDSYINADEWQKATQMVNFRPCDPNEKRLAGIRQHGFIGYDKDYLYFAFRTAGQNPKDLYMPPSEEIVRDGALYFGESVELHISPADQPEKKVQLIFSPAGAGIIYDERNRDKSFNTDAESAASLTNDGYSLEARVSWKSLEISPDAGVRCPTRTARYSFSTVPPVCAH